LFLSCINPALLHRSRRRNLELRPERSQPAERHTIPQPWALKMQWEKSRFIEYTDDTFTTRKPQPDWLGILGPVIRAEVGDEIVVDFLNRGHRGHDIHPHGLRYDKNNEGSLYLPVAKGAFVPPGGSYRYHWFANGSSGPGPSQPSSVVWWYHSHVDAAESESRRISEGCEPANLSPPS
jgi:manganese oxidase